MQPLKRPIPAFGPPPGCSLMEISVRKGLTLSQLEAFMHVAQMLSFRAAAKALNVSQPALTRTIKLAEERLQTQLFDRDKRNIELTPSGKKLLPIARRILRA